MYALRPYLLKHKNRIAAGIGFIILTNIFSAAGPKVLGFAIDGVRNGVSAGVLGMYAGLIILITAIQGVFRYQMRMTLIGFSRIAEYDMRNDIFAHLQKLPSRYYDHNKTGDLMARLTNDMNAVRMVLGPGIMYTLNTLILFVIVISLMLWVNPKLSLLALVPFPFLSLLVTRFGKLIYHRFESVQEQFSTITAKAQENIAGVRVIKAFTREAQEIKDFKNLNLESVDRNRHLIRIWSLFFPVMALLGGAGTAIVLWIGGKQVIDGVITLGDFVAFNTYLVLLIWPVISLGWVINVFQRGAASMGRIVELLEAPAAENGEQVAPPATDFKGDIRIVNLTFSYAPGQEPVLKDINIHIPAGSSAAIVGPTGSGKSTLVNLLSRTYDPPKGTIFLDGVDILDIPLSALREQFGYVPQETFLFSESIRDNILYGREDAPDAEMENASEIAQIRESILELTQKYETMLGERGINLSGGQKQRVAISRAVVRNPRILILDDALSSVDTYTEERILQHFQRLMTSRTSILISHRISTVKNADRIFVLEDGAITEQGNHEELLVRQGMYAGLYQKQLLAEELEAEENNSPDS